jgi:hypothetical protein
MPGTDHLATDVWIGLDRVAGNEPGAGQMASREQIKNARDGDGTKLSA